jgi:hypothetical protein
VLDDQHTLGVQAQAAALALEEVERGLLGDVEQRVELHGRVDREVDVSSGVSPSCRP